MAGPEVLLSEMGIKITHELKQKFPKSSFEYYSSDDEGAIARVLRGEAHLALVTAEIPTHLGLSTKIISESHFQTVVGKGHPLYSSAKTGKSIAVEKALEYPFVSPNHPLLGRVGLKQSLDGWRDDQFPRRIQYLTSSLELLGELVIQGKALAYLPDYYAERIGVETLKISGCPYSCSQKVRLVSKSPKDRSWLSQWF
jgi:DNA-binding transcriptional LysR family regulator